MMDQKGGAAYAGIIAIAFFFIIILVYGFLSQPISETIGEFENSATSGTSSIFTNIDLAWSIFPVVVVIIVIAWVLVHVYRREHEVAYDYQR